MARLGARVDKIKQIVGKKFIVKEGKGGRKGRQKKGIFGLQNNKKCIFFEKNVFCIPSTYLLTPRIELYIKPFQIYFY